MARFELRFKHRSPKICAEYQRRIRRGVYRIAYSVDDADVVIEVIKVGHRREVYRTP